MQISKKGKTLNYQTCLVSGGQDMAFTDNCWAATCGCEIKAPSLEKRKQKRNSRKMNASETNLKITKREKKQKVYILHCQYLKKTKAFKRTKK